jgi:hypothetical protein
MLIGSSTIQASLCHSNKKQKEKQLVNSNWEKKE